MPSLELVDPRTNPFLSGRFAPVHREVTVDELKVEGDLPAELVGAYVRNGPNPKYPPLGSYTFPMEGDGMLHGVWLEDGPRPLPQPVGRAPPASRPRNGRGQGALRRADDAGLRRPEAARPRSRSGLADQARRVHQRRAPRGVGTSRSRRARRRMR